jgi:DNA polymerase III delta prime subunit
MGNINDALEAEGLNFNEVKERIHLTIKSAQASREAYLKGEGDVSSYADTIWSLIVWGPPGIGKSTLVREVAKETGMPFAAFFLSHYTPPDWTGIPSLNKENKTTSFNPPERLLKDILPAIKEGKPVIVFLDELNKATKDLLAMIHQFILEGEFSNGMRLPPGSVIIAAGNQQKWVPTVHLFDSALTNRMGHLYMTYDLNQWYNNYGVQYIDSDILAFIMSNPKWFYNINVKDVMSQKPFPTPRSWKKASDMYKTLVEQSGREKARNNPFPIGMFCGESAQVAFTDYMKNRERFNKMDKILEGKVKSNKKEDIIFDQADQYPVIYYALSKVAREPKKYMDRFIAYLMGPYKIRKEIQSFAVKWMFHNIDIASNPEIGMKLMNDPRLKEFIGDNADNILQGQDIDVDER